MASTHNATATIISFPVAGDLSAFQYYPVTLTTAGLITTIGSTASVVKGVLQNAPDNVIEQMAAVTVLGPSKCVAYTGAIAPTDSLGVSANGVAEATTTDNRQIVGTPLEAAADIGVNAVIEILVNPSRY